jgi:hypothetical protein
MPLGGLEVVLVKYGVVPLGKNIYERFLSDAGDAVADAAVVAVRRAFDAVTRSDSESETEKARREAVAKMREAGATQADAEKFVDRTMQLATLSQAEQELYAIWTVMLFFLESADRLERPVALPGFFTGADWVLVIDTRRPPGTPRWEPQDPLASRWDDVGPASTSIDFLPDDLPASLGEQAATLFEGGRPRLWPINEQAGLAHDMIFQKEQEFRNFNRTSYPPLAEDVPSVLTSGYPIVGDELRLLSRLERRHAYRNGEETGFNYDPRHLADNIGKMRAALLRAIDIQRVENERSLRAWSEGSSPTSP